MSASRAAYLPALTVSALAGYEHVVFPFPPNLAPQGFLTFNAQEVFPQLTVKYLLLDFGGRAAAAVRRRSKRRVSSRSPVMRLLRRRISN